MVGTQSVSFFKAVRPAAIEILPPSRHGPSGNSQSGHGPGSHRSGGQDDVRPVLAVGRPRPATDAEHRFVPQQAKERAQAGAKQSDAEAQRQASRAAPDPRGTQAQTTNADSAEVRRASAEVLRFPARGAGMAATGFVAQLLAQTQDQTQAQAQTHTQLPVDDRSGRFAREAAVGTEAYRRAGGEPALYGEEPAYFRVAI